jgi:hypothetical protein
MTRFLRHLAAAMAAPATVVALSATAPATASTSPAHPAIARTVRPSAPALLKVIPLTTSRRAARAVTCSAPAHYFCVFEDAGCTINPYDVPTADHSAWFNFNNIGVPYHPQCILNPTNSSVWGEDEATEFAACAPPGTGISFSNEQFGWFFVKYNIGTCGSDPSGE